MESRIKNIILIILILVSSFLIGYIIIQKNNLEPPEVKYELHRDTVYVTDTIIKQKTKIQYITKDSIQYIYKTDSIVDTIKIDIPIEHKIYRDTITNDSNTYDISIRYSGYNSSIDELNIQSTYNNKIVIQKKKQRRFHISLQAGYYTGYNLIDKQIYSGPGGGIGFSYDIW